MSSCERVRLWKRILYLTGALTDIQRRLGGSSTAGGVPVDAVARRLILPGQILRFTTAAQWAAFKKEKGIQDADVEIISSADPLAPSMNSPVAGTNPLNFLRREQLPPMQIDMTRVYGPAIQGSYGAGGPGDWFIPAVANSYENPDPSYESYAWCSPYVLLNTYTPDPEQVPAFYRAAMNHTVLSMSEMEEVIESFEPDLSYTPLGTLSELTFYNADDYVGGPKDEKEFKQLIRQYDTVTDYPPWLASMMCFSAVSANVPFRIKISSDEAVAQPRDLSKPTVGCFWFNDGTAPRVELPRDPRCRACVLVRFKKWTLL